MDEFDAIARLFAPLTRNAGGAYDLKDDAAFLKNAGASGHVITTDTIIESVHFLRTDPPATVARKLLRVNLSDMIAKAATPVACLLNLSWPHDRSEADLAAFAAALGDDLEHLCDGAILLGGDTTALDGPMVASLTLIGEPLGNRPVLRRGAAPGDHICVTGVIGSAFIGLAQLTGQLAPPVDEALSTVYQVPEPPPLAFAKVVERFARASLDVSDGLIGDARHLAAMSGVEIILDLEVLPLAPSVARWRDGHPDPVAATVALASGGDDYQTMIALRAADVPEARASAERAGTTLTRVGICRAGAGVRLRFDNQPVQDEGPGGWRHGIGR